ncbi:hypothetical protein BTS2_1907 [Bacillus sp. TS-2]|nr:hypothetical protein BTS2_1907 [Bacillus sp. TS-2]
MKNALYILSILGCLAILVVSHLSYQSKLNNIAADAKNTVISSEGSNQEDQPSDNSSSSDSTNNDHTNEVNTELSGLLGEMSINEEELSIAYFGSRSLENAGFEDVSWPRKLDDLLAQVTDLTSTIVNVDSLSSVEVLQSEYLEEVIAKNPDLILFEPFILNDNGVVLIANSLNYIEDMMDSFSSELEETTVVVMPPNPIYSPNLYYTQIQELKRFAEEQNYLYANHWQAWPDIQSEEIKDYLQDGRPNEAGHQIWAEFMYDFLTE